VSLTPSSLRLAAALLVVALAPVSLEARPRPLRRPSALPRAATTAGAGPLVVLRTPPPPEVRIGGGAFTMGSSLPSILQALDLCKREAKPGACELPMLRETQLHGDADGVHPGELLANELEEHPVTLDPYWIDQREVTVAEYLRCVDAGKCTRPPYDSGGKRFARPDFPVSYVTWEDARTYCGWRGKRLPTEAEWERAARGVEGRQFPWGNGYNRRVSNHGLLGTTYRVWMDMLRGLRREKVSTPEHDGRDGFMELAPVGSFPDGRTPDGIDDLAGNVAEWVSDLYEPRHEAGAVTNPQGPGQSRSPFRVIRGGSYLHAAPWLRGAARLMASPEERMPWLGFRCARAD
jgi:formylglycine-generating enzyme required for sulfatase activity